MNRILDATINQSHQGPSESHIGLVGVAIGSHAYGHRAHHGSHSQYSYRDPKGYYELLGINPQASQDEIKRAFRVKSKELHPDKNRDEKATEAFQKMSYAYNVLSDPIERATYDAPYSMPRSTAGRTTSTTTRHTFRTKRTSPAGTAPQTNRKFAGPNDHIWEFMNAPTTKSTTTTWTASSTSTARTAPIRRPSTNASTASTASNASTASTTTNASTAPKTPTAPSTARDPFDFTHFDFYNLNDDIFKHEFFTSSIDSSLNRNCTGDNCVSTSESKESHVRPDGVKVTMRVVKQTLKNGKVVTKKTVHLNPRHSCSEIN